MDIEEYVKQKVRELKMFDYYKDKSDYMIVKHIFEKELMQQMKKTEDEV